VRHIPTIAVDFDGCLCEHAFPDCGPPRRDVIELVRALWLNGWDVVIHSCRANSDWVGKGAGEAEARAKVDEMLAWLAKYHVPYGAIWGIRMLNIGRVTNPAWDYSGVSGKPVADVYLDDRGLNPNLTGEKDVYNALLAQCEEITRKAGDPLAFHRSLGRSVR